MKKIIYIDLDGVIANFEKAWDNHPLKSEKEYKGRPDKLPNIFKDLEPIDGAIGAVNKIINSEFFDTYILSSAPWDNPDSWTHKRLWIGKYFGDKLRKRLILSHRKDLAFGDYLIDDKPWNGAKDFKGNWIHYGSNKFPDWSSILKYLKLDS